MRKLICVLLTVSLLFGPCALAAQKLDAYLVDPAPRAEEVGEFNGRLRRLDVEDNIMSDISGWNDGGFRDLTVGKLLVKDTPLYEIYKSDNAAKPIIIFLHGGGEGASKTEFLETACHYAQAGFYSLLIDAAGYGESDAGPIDAMVGTAQTVFEIDALIEYYDTVPEADAGRFCLYGHSMGGFIVFGYVAHGKYKPAAVACSCSSPSFTEIHEWPLYATTDHGVHIPNILSQKKIYKFAKEYSPLNWPERFLDVTLYACNGLADGIVPPLGCQQLEAKLKELGGDRFTFLYMEGRGHGDQYVLEDFQPFDTLWAAVMPEGEGEGGAAEGDATVVKAEPMGDEFFFELPYGWRQIESDVETGIAYASPENDRELYFWLLDNGERSLIDIYQEALESQQSAPYAFRELKIKSQSAMPYLFYVDDAGQFIAQIKRGNDKTLYMSLSDNGQGDSVFISVLDSIARLN